MSRLAAKIVQVQQGVAAGLPAGDFLRHDLEGLADDATALRKKIVATTEGGVITGEERLREHMDGSFTSPSGIRQFPTSRNGRGRSRFVNRRSTRSLRI